MKSSIIFTIKVWLTTGIFSPIIFNLIRYYFVFRNYSHDKDFKRIVDHLLAKAIKATYLGTAFDFLLAIILFTAIYFLSKQSAGVKDIKRHLYLLGILFFLIIFSLAWFEYSNEYRHYFLLDLLISLLCDILILTVSIRFYKLKGWEIKSTPVLE
jgi:hypothetical protein